MKQPTHERAEVLAGAIALGEATDDERVEYRQHLAGCERCLQAIGGELELERTAATVALARESEMWKPSPVGVLDRGMAARSRRLRVASAVTMACVALCAGLYLAVLTLVRVAPQVVAQGPVPPAFAIRHVTLERPAQSHARLQSLPTRKLVVVHNVVQLYRSQVQPPDRAQTSAIQRGVSKHVASLPRQIAEVVVHPAKTAARGSKYAASRADSEGSDWTTLAKTTTTALTESAPQFEPQNAESIHVSEYATREAAPVGGETAINPQPAMIAQSEGAEGTAVFETSIDEHGNPVKCTITKSSTYAVLDVAVCRAAMKVRYTPKTVNGRPVPGIYRDAFTFRLSGNPGE